MSDCIFDDSIWEYCLMTKLSPYIPFVKKWWENYTSLTINGTGVFDFEIDSDEELPPGLMVRVTSTAVRSPIKNIQIFPFVPSSYLQIAGVPGGTNKMIERVCRKGFSLEGVKIIEKHNLPSTYHKGQFLAFVPEDIYENSHKLGKYVYLTVAELHAIANNTLPQSIIQKCYKYIM